LHNFSVSFEILCILPSYRLWPPFCSFSLEGISSIFLWPVCCSLFSHYSIGAVSFNFRIPPPDFIPSPKEHGCSNSPVPSSRRGVKTPPEPVFKLSPFVVRPPPPYASSPSPTIQSPLCSLVVFYRKEVWDFASPPGVLPPLRPPLLFRLVRLPLSSFFYGLVSKGGAR